MVRKLVPRTRKSSSPLRDSASDINRVLDGYFPQRERGYPLRDLAPFLDEGSVKPVVLEELTAGEDLKEPYEIEDALVSTPDINYMLKHLDKLVVGGRVGRTFRVPRGKGREVEREIDRYVEDLKEAGVILLEGRLPALITISGDVLFLYVRDEEGEVTTCPQTLDFSGKEPGLRYPVSPTPGMASKYFTTERVSDFEGECFRYLFIERIV
jgi:5-keto 4-deoxyuronate isomerase